MKKTAIIISAMLIAASMTAGCTVTINFVGSESLIPSASPEAAETALPEESPEPDKSPDGDEITESAEPEDTALPAVSTVMPSESPKAVTEPKYIVDNANFLTTTQTEELNKLLNDMSEESGIKAAVVTESKMSGKDAESSAESILESGLYDFGANDNLVLLYISKNPRNYYIYKSGEGVSAVGAKSGASLESSLLPSLQENKYYTGIRGYADTLEEILTAYSEENAPATQKPAGFSY